MTTTRAAAALVALALVVASAAGCKRENGDTFLIVALSLVPPAPAPPVTAVQVVVEAGQERRMSEFSHDGDQDGVIAFPATFSLQLPRKVGSPLRLEVRALDAAGLLLAMGKVERVEFSPGEHKDVAVPLVCMNACDGSLPGVDAGRPDGGDGGPGPRDALVTCGNGELEDGELCDPGIAAGRPGACPPVNCDDKIPCTEDIPVGTACRLTCMHRPIDVVGIADRCCPANATAMQDVDCPATCGNGKRDPEEICDTTIQPGQPGACPTTASCDDADACTEDALISGGTCAAVCAHHRIGTAYNGDGCCPYGVTASEDSDCPAVCGNWHRDPGERCDRALPSATASGCPMTCEATPSETCVVNTIAGAGCSLRCMSSPITNTAPDDRCCPKDATRNVDSDCPSICGNALVEPGEACDKDIAAGAPGACPGTCSKPADQCLMARVAGNADDCSSTCKTEPLGLCAPGDGCCPTRCTAATDPDCSATCGNGAVDPGETCDTAIATGAGACPTSCSDGLACTTDVPLSFGTCHARCAYVPVTGFAADGCCPPGGHNLLDRDCPAACGNRLVEAPETCDRAIPAGAPGACATKCPDLPAGCSRFVLRGGPETCSSQCVMETLTTCANGDGCCPAGCTRLTDDDCPAVCGNGAVEPGETCDTGATAGKPGACAAVCEDGDACTTDVTLGRRIDCTRSCRFDPITACRSGDRCCPSGCTRDDDTDCVPAMCGNRTIEAGEFCDPPGTCPTRCPDDGDPCTSEIVTGEARLCAARCRSVPIDKCSGAEADRCCPSGCAAKTDVDCALPPTQPPLL